MIERYEWAGGSEAMLRFGPATGPIVIVALPLFEEANRTRTFVVSILRLLAARGVASALPDLPGQGESVLPTDVMRLRSLRSAFTAAATQLASAGRSVCTLAVRSGALIDTEAAVQRRWHLAPHHGSALIRELGRIAGRTGADWWREQETIEIAGNRVTSDFLADVAEARPVEAGAAGTLRIVRYEADPAAADLKIIGMPLWRRSEPDNDLAVAQRLTDDIAQWMAGCAA